MQPGDGQTELEALHVMAVMRRMTCPKPAKVTRPLLGRPLDWSTALNSGQFTNQLPRGYTRASLDVGSLVVICLCPLCPLLSRQHSIKLMQYLVAYESDTVVRLS
jgi:hypothetical protein